MGTITITGRRSLVDVTMNRRQLRTDNGFRDLGTVFSEAGFRGRYSDSDPDGIVAFLASGEESRATHFDNRSVVLRGEPGEPAGGVNSRSDSGDTCRSTRRRARRRW